jgi:hypothetical protein
MAYASITPLTLADNTSILERAPGRFSFLASDDVAEAEDVSTFFYQDKAKYLGGPRAKSFYVNSETTEVSGAAKQLVYADSLKVKQPPASEVFGRDPIIGKPWGRIEDTHDMTESDLRDSALEVLAGWVDASLLVGMSNETQGSSVSLSSIPHSGDYLDALYNRLAPTKTFRFHTFHHPLVCEFIRRLKQDGIPGLLRREVQGLCLPSEVLVGYSNDSKKVLEYDFKYAYSPDDALVKTPYPIEDVDFRYGAPYAIYNWELFFHLPLLLADRLSKNQRFEDAYRWFHYIFDPQAQFSAVERSLEPNKDPSARYWKVLPFYNNYGDTGDARQSLLELMALLHVDDSDSTLKQLKEDLIALINDWRDDPFKPHLIARHRLVAYQKSVVMKYIDNLIAWGDQLFRRDTLESINEATLRYILAAEILGPRPAEVAPRVEFPVQTYRQLESELSEFGNALIELEGIPLPPRTASGYSATKLEQLLAMGSSLFFCIPQNDDLLKYWDTVEDRLFKIRHCMNIEGVTRELPLFEPPIDPALLVKAVAAGIDISSVLNDLYAPRPHYRFQYMLQKSLEVCSEVKALSSALLTALEKYDAEKLALLHAEHERGLLEAIRDVKKLQIQEANETLASLEGAKALAQERFDYYSALQKVSEGESENTSKLSSAAGWQESSQLASVESSLMFAIPDVTVGTPGGTTFGGSHIGHIYKAIAESFGFMSMLDTYDASMSKTQAEYERRWSEWKFQERLADKELKQIEKQIAAATLRQQITDAELANHEKQIDNAREVEAYLKSKYTNSQLYEWMKGQIAEVYFQSYQLAYDLARGAERAYQNEIGSDASFVKFGYWDSLKKGLLAGEKLYHDLRRMEASYHSQNKREYEITKHISLLLNDPLALMELKTTGHCRVELPELLFDADYPGHYFRRIKNVSLSIPAVVGPYTSINCTLTLLKSSVRVTPNVGARYNEDTENADARFSYDLAPLQRIATSHGQTDTGLFELNFRDERYLPFEGAGAISTWRIDLPKENNAFDLESVSDVILTLRYCAREGGELLRRAAQAALSKAIADTEKTVLHRLFSARHEFPDAWYRCLHPLTNEAPKLGLTIDKERFPYLFRSGNITITYREATVFAKLAPDKSASSTPDITLDITTPQNELPHLVLKEWEDPSVLSAELIKMEQVDGVWKPQEGEKWNEGLDSNNTDWTIKGWSELSGPPIQDILLLLDYTVSEKPPSE